MPCPVWPCLLITHTGFCLFWFRFLKFGPLRYARITMDGATGRSRGTGFVCFWNRADADSAVEKSDSIRSDMAGAAAATLVRSCCNRHVLQLS